MNRFKNYLLTICGITFLLGTFSMIHVGRTVADAIKDVRVANSETDPALVRDVENPARHPVQHVLSVIIPNGQFIGDHTLNLSPGVQRFIIEQVSINGFTPQGQKIRCVLRSTLNGTEEPHFLPATFLGTFTNQDQFVTSEMVRWYADPGSPLTLRAERNSSVGDAGAFVIITGYTIPVP
jgi:hypothetical protein